MSVHSKSIPEVQPTRSNVSRFIYFYKMLYMFQAVPPPIIRSTKCTYGVTYFQLILLLAASVDEMELA